MAKQAKTRRLTAKRKAFLDALSVLCEHFDDDGFVKSDSDSHQIADLIVELFDKWKKPAKLDLCTFATVCGSALWLLNQTKSERNIDDCSETCVGAEIFEAAFFAGWSIAFESALKSSADK